MGYEPKIIIAGRDLNNEMSNFVAKEFAEYISNAGYDLNTSKILILGLTFKENCPDTRNSKVFDLIEYLNTLVGSIVYMTLGQMNLMIAWLITCKASTIKRIITNTTCSRS